jgi:hypothetical protein
MATAKERMLKRAKQKRTFLLEQAYLNFYQVESPTNKKRLEQAIKAAEAHDIDWKAAVQKLSDKVVVLQEGLEANRVARGAPARKAKPEGYVVGANNIPASVEDQRKLDKDLRQKQRKDYEEKGFTGPVDTFFRAFESKNDVQRLPSGVKRVYPSAVDDDTRTDITNNNLVFAYEALGMGQFTFHVGKKLLPHAMAVMKDPTKLAELPKDIADSLINTAKRTVDIAKNLKEIRFNKPEIGDTEMALPLRGLALTTKAVKQLKDRVTDLKEAGKLTKTDAQFLRTKIGGKNTTESNAEAVESVLAKLEGQSPNTKNPLNVKQSFNKSLEDFKKETDTFNKAYPSLNRGKPKKVVESGDSSQVGSRRNEITDGDNPVAPAKGAPPDSLTTAEKQAAKAAAEKRAAASKRAAEKARAAKAADKLAAEKAAAEKAAKNTTTPEASTPPPRQTVTGSIDTNIRTAPPPSPSPSTGTVVGRSRGKVDATMTPTARAEAPATPTATPTATTKAPTTTTTTKAPDEAPSTTGAGKGPARPVASNPRDKRTAILETSSVKSSSSPSDAAKVAKSWEDRIKGTVVKKATGEIDKRATADAQKALRRTLARNLDKVEFNKVFKEIKSQYG